MALFKKKTKVIPNYNTVPSKNGPVIDVFSLDGDGYNTINADNSFLLLSGLSYWNMEVMAYGCNKDVNVARSNSSRFFAKLWDNKYYETQPLIGWYMALYAVFHDNGWSDISRQTMKVWCESIFTQSKLHTQEAWYLAMMYTSLCGGSIDDVVLWLHKLLESKLTHRKVNDGCSMMMPVLRHYKVLQAIVKHDPFTPPASGGNLAEYWDYIANKYLLEEARLEAAFVRIFLAHDPYYPPYYEITDHRDPDLDPSLRARYKGIEDEVTLFNSAAKSGNPLALSVVYYSNWIYESAREKSKYPSFDSLTINNDDYIRKNKDTVFQNIYSGAKAISDRAVDIGQALQKAEEHYAKGLYLYSVGKKSTDEMKSALKYAGILKGVQLPRNKLNPVTRRAVWLYHVAGEKNPPITPEDIKAMYEIEKLAVSLQNHPSELKFRKLGHLLRDGFMNMQPQPELWEKLRDQALTTAGDYGITKYILDENDMAEYQFQCVIENKDNFWSEKHITAAWLGLAWLRYSKKDYSSISEALEYVSRDEKIAGQFGDDFVNNHVEDARNNRPDALETLASLYCKDKQINKRDPVLKDLGKHFACYLSNLYQQQLAGCTDKGDTALLLTKLVKTEMEYVGYFPRLYNFIIRGLDLEADYFYSLLKDPVIYGKLRTNLYFDDLLAYLCKAAEAGYDFEKEIDDIRRTRNRIQAEIKEENFRKDHPEFFRPEYKIPDYKPLYDNVSVVDVLLDAVERSSNPDGLTNEELYIYGSRSEVDHEEDKLIRDFLKNPFK